MATVLLNVVLVAGTASENASPSVNVDAGGVFLAPPRADLALLAVSLEKKADELCDMAKLVADLARHIRENSHSE